MSENNNSEEITDENITVETKPLILGKYKMPGVIGFSTIRGNVKINSDEAFIKGGFLSGMLDHLIFKITIRDDETIDFEEVDTCETDESMRGRLLEKFYDAELKIGKLGGMYDPSDFEFTSTVECKITNKFLPLILLSSVKRPIDKLSDILYGNTDPVEVSPATLATINDLLGDIVRDTKPLGTAPVLAENVDEVTTDETNPGVDQTQKSSVNHLKVTREELIDAGVIHRDELGQAILQTNEQVTAELKKMQERKKQEQENATERIRKAQVEIDDLQLRIDKMAVAPEKNGMLFSVSESITDSDAGYQFEPEVIAAIRNKVSGIKGINGDAFVSLFENGKYIITIGDANGDMLSEANDSKLPLPLGTIFSDGKFIYTGEMQWHALVSEMLKLGYSQDSEFEQKAGSNSYNTKSRLDSTPEPSNGDDTTKQILDMITLPKNSEPGKIKPSNDNWFVNMFKRIKNLF